MNGEALDHRAEMLAFDCTIFAYMTRRERGIMLAHTNAVEGGILVDPDRWGSRRECPRDTFEKAIGYSSTHIYVAIYVALISHC